MKKTFIQKVCGAKVFALMFTTLACVVITACSSDDEEDSAASEIVGTWIMDDDVSITFNANNTGYITALADDDDEDYTFAKSLTRAAQTQTISFTYNYDASARKLTMTAYGETETWTDVSITDGVLYATDSDGDRITAVKQGSDTADVVTGDIDISKLYGTWIVGTFVLTITEDELTINEYPRDDEPLSWTFTYTYDKDTHTLNYSEEGTQFTNTITALTNSRLSLSNFKNSGYPLTFARKGIEIGDISLLYDKKWILGSNEKLSFYFSSKDSSSWTYDAQTRTITTTVFGNSWKITILGLTSDVLFGNIDDGESEDDGKNVVFYAY